MESPENNSSRIETVENCSAPESQLDEKRLHSSAEATGEPLKSDAQALEPGSSHQEPHEHDDTKPTPAYDVSLEYIDLVRAKSLGYPTEETPSRDSPTSSLSYQDLEKGIGADIIQHQLGANEVEEADDLPFRRQLGHSRQPFNDTGWISVPPKNLPQLPPKRARRIWRRLRHTLFAVYQRLFSIVLIANIVSIIIVLTTRRNKQPPGPSLGNLATATAANLAVTILIRQEMVINALYTICCWTPYWFPLRIRRLVAKVYEFGGVHSGGGVSATLWFVLFVVFATRDFAQEDLDEPAVLALAYIILGLLLGICTLSFPRFRVVSHNTFERVHRFAGWLGVALFWAELLLLAKAQSRVPGSDRVGILVIKAPAFWFLLLITFYIILPWLRLRKVDVVPEKLSDHALRLHFRYTDLGPVMGIRITHSPLKEWHSFASIPGPDKTFSLIISDAGDWTKKQIAETLPKYWVRGVPVAGVLRMAFVFKRIVVVTTGSGIGPCLSMLVSYPKSARILWSTPEPQQTYGDTIVQAVLNEDPNAMIINTRASGRPDMVALTYHLFIESQAEAVFIISNPSLTRKVVYGMESRGIPAYGPVFDS
ncbi:MAG: hypothetical protein Q9191_006559 [Dirinaria sp. TL-2023a]